MKKLFNGGKLFFAVFMFGSLAGCASVTTGQNQTLSVETPGSPEATCELSNDKGKWFVASTPGSVTVNRAYGDLSVHCKSKCGKKSGNILVKSSTKGMAFGNLIMGGIVGAAVDVGTGSAYDYPNMITVPLTDAKAEKTEEQTEETTNQKA